MVNITKVFKMEKMERPKHQKTLFENNFLIQKFSFQGVSGGNQTGKMRLPQYMLELIHSCQGTCVLVFQFSTDGL